MSIAHGYEMLLAEVPPGIRVDDFFDFLKKNQENRIYLI